MENTLELDDGGFLSYRYNHGGRSKTVLFMHGTLSDKNSTKSLFLEEYCKDNDLSFAAFDFTGHGQSSGKYEQATIGVWLRDALEIIDRVIVDDVYLVGSSMGGWIALLAAKERPDRVKGVVGLASAADFTADVWAAFSDEQKKKILDDGVIYTPNGWTEQGDPWSRDLFWEAEQHFVLQGTGSFDLACPLVLIHGDKDDCVPVRTAFKIMDAVKTQNCKAVVLKGAGHRLSEPSDLKALSTELNLLTADDGE